jgi:hypothetical protein
LNEIYLPANLLVDTSYDLRAMSHTKFKVKQGFSGYAPDKIVLKGEIIKKKNRAKQSYRSLALHSASMPSTTVCSLNKLCPRVFKLCSRQNGRTRQQLYALPSGSIERLVPMKFG